MFKKREKPLLSMEEICEMNNISYGDSVEEDALDLSEIGNIFDNNSEFLLFDRRYSAHNFNSISFSYSESDNRKIISSEKSNFDSFPFEISAKTKRIIGMIIPESSHHFEPITMISSWIPDKRGISFGVKKINKLKHKQKLSDVTMIGISLFFFIDLR